PECSCIVVLNGIEQVAVEEVEPYDDADLSLIDQHEENDHRHTEPPLERCKWTKGPDAKAVNFISIEIPVGDPHDLADGVKSRHEGKEEGKGGRGGGQGLRGQVLGVISGQKPGPARQDSKTKYDCLGRKDADEYLQEA